MDDVFFYIVTQGLATVALPRWVDAGFPRWVDFLRRRCILRRLRRYTNVDPDTGDTFDIFPFCDTRSGVLDSLTYRVFFTTPHLCMLKATQ